MYKTLPIDVPYSTYKKVLDAMCDTISKYLLIDSDGFKLPYGLGFIQIGKYRPKNFDANSLSVDYKTSKLLNKRVYHLNEHSDGYKYRLYWSKIPYTFKERYQYSLNLVRANKRKLAQLIFNRHDYLNIDDIQLYKV